MGRNAHAFLLSTQQRAAECTKLIQKYLKIMKILSQNTTEDNGYFYNTSLGWGWGGGFRSRQELFQSR